MIEIDYHLLSSEALDNLIIELITREATDYGEAERAFSSKKQELLARLEQGDAVIAYSSAEGYCSIIPVTEKESASK